MDHRTIILTISGVECTQLASKRSQGELSYKLLAAEFFLRGRGSQSGAVQVGVGNRGP